jgi:hypothetical protein
MKQAREEMIDLVERLGLDWLVVLIGRPAFQDAALPYPETISEVRAKFSGLVDGAKIDDAVDYCSGLLKREEERSDKIESKAFTLIGITGIAAGFITGFASLLLDRGKMAFVPALVVAVLLYIFVVVSLMMTIFLAVKVVTVLDYRFTYPSANDVFELPKLPLADVKIERAASLFYSFSRNVRVVNRKATYLGGAQLWFRNSIVLLLLLTLLLGLYAPVNLLFVPNTTVTPTPNLVPSATETPHSISTPTSIAPTHTSFTMPGTSTPSVGP